MSRPTPRPATARPPATGSRSPSPAALVAEGLAAFLAFGAASLGFLRPMVSLWRDHLAPDLGDPLFNLYVLKWNLHQLRTGLPNPWEAPFFHPLPDALALSDHLFGPSLVAWPVAELTGSPVAAYNALLFLAFALTGTTTYLVLRAAGMGRTAAAVGGAVFVFLPYRWEQTSHLQIVFAPFLPLVLWTFDRLLAEPRPRRALAFLAVYVLHLGGGTYLAAMIHVPLLVLLLNRWPGRPGWRRWRQPRALATLAATAAVAAALLAALFLPYARSFGRLDHERSPAEFQRFGASLVAHLTPARASRHWETAEPLLRPLVPRLEDGWWFAEKSLFPGFVPLLLAAVAVAVLWRRSRRRPPPEVPERRRLAAAQVAGLGHTVFAAADLYSLGWIEAPAAWRGRIGLIYGVLGLALVLLFLLWVALRRRWGLGSPVDPGSLAAGPGGAWERGLLLATVVTFLFAFPVVFTPAAELLPGLAGMRVPARFFVFTSFGVAWLAARGTGWLLPWVRRPGWRRAAGPLILAAVLVEAAPRPLPWFEVPLEEDFPPTYHWLAEHRGEVGAVLELPFRPPPGAVGYMYFSTLHWRPLVNGYSGALPPHYLDLQADCCRPYPTAGQLRAVQDWGVTHLVIHRRELEGINWHTERRWRRLVRHATDPDVRLEHEAADGTAVYVLDPPPSE